MNADTYPTTGTHLLRGSLFRIVGSATAAIISFFMLPFLVSHLGNHWYGVWASVGSLIGNYYLLDLGLSTGVTRYVTESLAKNDADRANDFISTSFWIYCGLALILALFTLLIAGSMSFFVSEKKDVPIIQLAVLISGLTIVVGFPFKALAGIIQAKLRYDLLSLINLIILIGASGLTVLLVSSGYGIIALAVVGLLASVLSDLGFFAISKKLFPELNIRWQRRTHSLTRELFSFSIWAFLINTSNQIRLRIDPLIVGGIGSASAVTHYSVGSRVAEVASEFLYQATNMVQPIVTRYHATDDHERMRAALVFLTKINVTLGAFVLGMLIILGRSFIVRWMGADFGASSEVLYVLAFALTVGLVVNPLDYTLIAILRHRFLAMVNVIEAIAKLALSISLGTRFGLLGIAFGTLIPMTISRFFVVVPYACREIGLSARSYYAPMVLVIVFAGSVFVPISIIVAPMLEDGSYGTFAIIVLCAALVYCPVIFFLAFNAHERQLFLLAVRGFRKNG